MDVLASCIDGWEMRCSLTCENGWGCWGGVEWHVRGRMEWEGHVHACTIHDLSQKEIHWDLIMLPIYSISVAMIYRTSPTRRARPREHDASTKGNTRHALAGYRVEVN
jgi:hypothetical protein